MGGQRFNSGQWASYVNNHVAGKTQAQVFTASSVNPDLDPLNIKFRESRDSAVNPNSTALILASDITGSMGFIANELLRSGIPTVATEIYKRKPISDPHIMVMGVGDAKTDSGPLQATQFEADATALASQIQKIWLEGNGGGNNGESYNLVHLFAGMKTKIDCAQRGMGRGSIFTIGDEPLHQGVLVEEAKRILGIDLERDMSAADCIALASRTYDVYHIVLASEGYCANGGLPYVLETWKRVLPERTLVLEDYRVLAELIVSVLQVNAGADHAAVAGSWSGNTSVVVANAIKDLALRNNGADRGVTRLA